MIVMLLWAGKFKMTAPGAEGIIPLVTNSPLISWQFKVFGPYIRVGYDRGHGMDSSNPTDHWLL